MVETLVKWAKKNKLVTKLRLRFPLVFLYFVVKPLTYFRYSEEKRLLKGNSTTLSADTSILLYTTHKCASTYTTKILAQLAGANGMTSADIEAYFSVKSIDPRKYFSSKANQTRVFKPSGYYLGPLRYFYDLTDIDKYKKVLVLRDPRDVLTSFYYSKKYSHIIISEAFYAERQKYADHDIDQFVLDYLPEVKQVYQDYVDKLLPLPNLCILPYERLVDDFESWLSQLLDFLDLPEVPQSLIDSLIAKEASVEATGSETAHIRNKQPGDYKRKLKPETQKRISEEFGELLGKLGY